jgi:hypothetical protein
MSWEKIKLGVWSAIGGAILLAIVGFSWTTWEAWSSSWSSSCAQVGSYRGVGAGARVSRCCLASGHVPCGPGAQGLCTRELVLDGGEA